MENTQCSEAHPDAPQDGLLGRYIRITKTTAMQTVIARLTSPLTLLLALDPILERITAQRHLVME